MSPRQETPEIERVVLEALDSEDPNVLRAACVMSGELGLAEAERGLLKALVHKAWQVRLEAAKALGKCGTTGAIPFLKRILKASTVDLRQKLLAAATGQGLMKTELDDDTPPQVQKAAAVALNRLDPSITQDVLLAALGGKDPNLLVAATAGLANLESNEGRERMVELLGHENATVRKAAVMAMGKLKEPAGVETLLKLLKDPDADTRKEALIALNNIKDPRAIEPMANLLADPEPMVRRVAAIALGNTRSTSKKIASLLLKGLNDRSPEVRGACLSALGNLRQPTAMEAAASLLRDSHEEVIVQAAKTVLTLAAIRERGEYPTPE